MDPNYIIGRKEDPVSNCSIFMFNVKKPQKPGKLKYKILLNNENNHIDMTDEELNLKYSSLYFGSTKNSTHNLTADHAEIMMQSRNNILKKLKDGTHNS